MSIIIWIDQNIHNEENQRYVEDLEELDNKKIIQYQKVSDAIEYMKSILFEETKIIVSGRLFDEFINALKKNINDICFAPKIIVFTTKEKKFLEYNPDYEKIENKFYTFGGIATIISKIKDFLNEEINNNINDDSQNMIKDSNNKIIFSKVLNETKDNKNDSNVQLIFEYIDSRDKLVLPMFFKALIDAISNENMEEYTKLLYKIYSKDNESVKNLLEQILMMKNIPIQILTKYYARLYTLNSNFYKDLNKDLRMNNKDKYLSYIKTFYEGVKLKSLPLANDKILYRGGYLSNDEIGKIKIYLKNKIEGLPGSIVFSKSFLSFSKDEKKTKNFFKNTDKNLSKVLFKLINDNNEGYNLCTHGDIEKISYYPDEKEVLFFPFSSFEIKDIKEIKIEGEKIYEINLLYLGKYLKDIENDKNINIIENKIPDTEFKKQLLETGLIKEEKIENINIKILYNSYKKYEKDINIKQKNDNNDANGDIENLDKYLKDIENDKNINIIENKIPYTEFKKQLCETGLIKEEKLNNINTKILYNNHKQYEKEINNIIIGEINIKSDDINKDIRIINSFENVKENIIMEIKKMIGNMRMKKK